MGKAIKTPIKNDIGYSYSLSPFLVIPIFSYRKNPNWFSYKMMKLLLIAAAAFVAVSADPSKLFLPEHTNNEWMNQWLFVHIVHYDKITEEINKAVDEAVAAIEKSETFDPMKVPDHSDKFERHIGIIDLKGELDMRNIQVRGLKQMKRVGDANVKSEDGVVKAHLLVGVHDDVVSMEYDLAYKLGDLHPNTHVISDIQDFVVELSLEVSEEGNMTLTSFEVRQFANVVNHIGGLSILDPIFAVLSDVLTAIFQDTVRAEMTKVLAPAFKKELERNNQ